MAIFKKNEERENALDRVNENIDSLHKIEEIMEGGLNNIGIAGRTKTPAGKEHQTAFFDLSPQIAKKILALFNQQRQSIVKQILSDVNKYEIELTDEDEEIIQLSSPSRKQENIMNSPEIPCKEDEIHEEEECTVAEKEEENEVIDVPTQEDTNEENIPDPDSSDSKEEYPPSPLRNFWQRHSEI